ncbi:hypothetical protein V2H26_07675, partial [Xanthomonas euvesicatoria]|nr:hypothetical protein [Xanthomonas euvesicatoria]
LLQRGDNLALGELALAHRWSPWWLVCPETSSYGWINFTGSRHRDTLNGVRVPPSKPNTGAQRSTGPNPPTQPFVVNVSRPGVADRAVDVSLRVAWVAGFIQTADLHPGPSGMLTPFKDSRMWIAGFKPDGNRDK